MPSSLKKKKKEHLKQKLDAVYKNMWDREFLMQQLREDRETFRMEYDRMVEQRIQVEQKISKEEKKEDRDKDTIIKLKKLSKSKGKDIKQLKKRMDALDVQVEGPLVDENDPQQQDQSVKGQINGYRAVIPYLEKYIDNI